MRPQQISRGPIVTGLELVSDGPLKDDLTAYYTLESKGDWEKTYNYRSVTFRRTIPYETYKLWMDQDSRGWALIKVEILEQSVEYDSNIDEEVTFINIAFTDEIMDVDAIIERNWSRSYQNGKQYKTVNRTIWAHREEAWTCLDCGRRLHMTFNARFTMK